MSSAMQTARADIESAVSVAWAGATAIQWADRPFSPPSGGTWLRATPIFGDAFPLTMGDAEGALNRVVGVLDLSLFVRKGDGLGATVTSGDTLRLAFNQTTQGTVRFGVCSGPDDVTQANDGYAHLQVSAPFEVIYEGVTADPTTSTLSIA